MVLAGKLGIFDMVVINLPRKNSGFGFGSEIRPYFIDELPAEIEDCLYRKYDKEALDANFIEGGDLLRYCMHDQCTEFNAFVDFPTCWAHLIDGSHPSEDISIDREPSQSQAQYLRPVQIDKLVCQAIAKSLWDIYPTMTIAAMTEHPAILDHGGGKLYKGKNTLRDWLSEVAPESVRKPGRPKNSKPSNDAP